MESELVRDSGNYDIIDRTYYNKLVDDAVEVISQYCDFEWFVSDDPYVPKNEFMNQSEEEPLPWAV